jgi:hypothetical protein
MATSYEIKRNSEGKVSIKPSSRRHIEFYENPDVVEEITGGVRIKYKHEDENVLIANGVTVQGELFSGTAAELLALLLEDIFPDYSTGGGSGSSTTSTIILAAPDDSQWILGVNDSGALTTTELATPVAGAALTSVTLTSADGTEWEVSVTNVGALTTTEVV